MWADVNRKLNVAVSFNEYVEGEENFLPYASQGTKQLCQLLIKIMTQNKNKEQEEEGEERE
jgi:hypothetical protein